MPANSIRAFGRWLASWQSWAREHPRKTEIQCVILFVAGFLEDFILSFDTLFTAGHYWFPAAMTSFIVVLFQFAVFPFILDEKLIVNWTKLSALGLGCATGAAIAVAFGP